MSWRQACEMALLSVLSGCVVYLFLSVLHSATGVP